MQTAAGCRRPRTEREITLAPVPEASREARRFVRHHLPALGFPNKVDDATLIAVELVTNAVRHAPDGPIWLSLRLAGGRALMEVQDCSPELPVFREPGHMAESGRGLHVVKELSAAFDWTPVDGGKVVWSILK
ncbi:MAG TPA: ATP-binding protein [Streptosporangiaceae bacterium]|jgi:anti-sigma regulatory factor (Ser/Thr protein kinase)